MLESYIYEKSILIITLYTVTLHYIMYSKPVWLGKFVMKIAASIFI